VINDACCLIDLHKVDLVEAMLKLPYRFIVALPVAQNELLNFSKENWRSFGAAGLEQVDLTGAQVGRAIKIRSTHKKLSAEDCLSIVLAEDTEHSMLLTADAELRRVAEDAGHPVHGVLWVSDELYKYKILGPDELCGCLISWLDDPLVRLPEAMIQSRLRALGKK
jgi:predicted nucleic acid-binding protein